MYDLIVIGAGPGGYVAAIRGTQQGLKTALIEARDVGGVCLNRGCIPTKTILHMSHLYKELKESEHMGIFIERPTYDIKKMHEKKDSVVTKLRDGIKGLLKANDIDVFSGYATILKPQTVEIKGEHNTTINGKNIIIATGAAPFMPPIKGIDLPGVITSDNLLEDEQKPLKSLTIIGGGVIGVEMASIYSNLGTQVTIIEAFDRILPLLDKEIGQSLSMIFKKRGIQIFTNASVKEISQGTNGLIASFEDKKGEQTVESENILISTGRRANIDSLFASDLSVKYDRGIVINESFETSIPSVYAIGDCTSGSIQLAHASSAQATNLIAMLCGKPAPMNLSLIPSCIYTEPEIATVGLTEDSAKKQGIKTKSTKYLMSGHAKSILEGHDRGFIKLIFDENTQILIGAQLMCGRATDIISNLTVAIGSKFTASQLASFVQPHPSFVEGIEEAADSFYGHAIHITPPRKR